MALQVVFATRQNALIGMFVEHESAPGIPLIFPISDALFSVSMYVVGIAFSGEGFRKLASSSLVSHTFRSALFAVATTTISRTNFRPTYLTCDPFDKIKIFLTLIAYSFFRAGFAMSSPAFSRLAFLFAYFTRFPDDLRIRN